MVTIMRATLLLSIIVISMILLGACTSAVPYSEPAEDSQPAPAVPPSESTPVVPEGENDSQSNEEPAESQMPSIEKYEMRFGINGGMYPDISEGAATIRAVTADLDKLGMVWLRHPGKGTTWFAVQPNRGAWEFGKLDAVINNNKHPWVMELYGASGTVYPFGQDEPVAEILKTLAEEEGSQAVYEFIKEHSVDMENEEQRADAEKYVKTFVNRYKDKIKYWEIGNEGIVAPGTFDIIRNTYTWIKEVYPEAMVIITGVAGDDDQMFNEHLEALGSLLAKGIGEYFDIANIHYYGRIRDKFDVKLEKIYEDYKATMDKYGVEKPIWVTETSTSSHANSVLSGPSSEQEQARHVVKRLVIFSAKGAEKVFWHDYKETYSDNKFYQCNLVDPETSIPKPAYYTYKLVVEKIGYYRTVQTLMSGPVSLYKFTNPNNQHVLVAWAESPKTVDLTEFIEAENVLVTRIVENASTNPQTSIAKTSAVQLTVSPIFIEYKAD